jgi:deferrochelatase/peroxidase EfeB
MPGVDASEPGSLTEGPPHPGLVSRRWFLGALGAGAVGAGLGGGYAAAEASGSDDSGGSPGATVPFYGLHQAGIATPAQDRLTFGVLNLVDGVSAGDVRAMLQTWTEAASRMTRGEPVGEDTRLNAPPLDTGEALGSPPASLTITLGFGPTFFDQLGLSRKRPTPLVALPPLPNENLDPNYTGGDLCIQACSNDPLVAFHAVRNLARLGMGVVEHSWMQLGFGRTSTTSTGQTTPRNLLGFKDGTRNIKAQDLEAMNEHVWVGAETDQPWLRDGSYLIARRIRMFIENWDRDYLADQQNTIGRSKSSGAPLGATHELDTPDFEAEDDEGNPVIPVDAHIRLASREANHGIQILRRGYSYTDGIDPVRGTLLGGLFFIAFVQNPSQFITLQRQVGTHDALNEYIQHQGSGVFACPPGLQPGQHWGDDIFA